eukprot:5160159-Pyramimonas_sp.AAC.1
MERCRPSAARPAARRRPPRTHPPRGGRGRRRRRRRRRWPPRGPTIGAGAPERGSCAAECQRP